MFWWNVVWSVVRLGRGWEVDVGVSAVACVDLVVLAKVLDDAQVGAGRFHEAGFQQPAVRVRVGVPLSQHILQGGLEVTDPCQY